DLGRRWRAIRAGPPRTRGPRSIAGSRTPTRVLRRAGSVLKSPAIVAAGPRSGPRRGCRSGQASVGRTGVLPGGVLQSFQELAHGLPDFLGGLVLDVL